MSILHFFNILPDFFTVSNLTKYLTNGMSGLFLKLLLKHTHLKQTFLHIYKITAVLSSGYLDAHRILYIEFKTNFSVVSINL